MIREPVKAIEFDPDTDEVILNPSADLANDDWIRAARLLKKAKAGDEKARAKLERMYSVGMVRIHGEIEGL